MTNRDIPTSATSASITVEYGHDDMDRAEIWPDGDAPKLWNADTIAAMISGCGDLDAFNAEWDFGYETTITIVDDLGNTRQVTFPGGEIR